MVLVYIKNLLFPRPRPRADSTAPLLPTAANAKACGHPDCPCRPKSRAGSDAHDDEEPDLAKKPWLNPRTVSDAIIGLSDGLTVPFALAAGLSAFESSKVVLYGGLAELIAGSISMGLGGWLAGRGEAEFYAKTLSQTTLLVFQAPEDLATLVHTTFSRYSLPQASLDPLITSLLASPPSAVEFLMRFHHGLQPSERTPLRSAATIAAGYFIGGFVPLLPYFFVGEKEVLKGLAWSVGVMAVCLFWFGVGRTVACCEERRWRALVRGGVEMMAVGGVAAAASWGIIRALGSG